MVSFQKRSAPNVECRMSNVEDGQKTPWTLSKVPSAPIWCSPVRKKRKRKRKMKGNQICEKMTAQTENFLITYWLSRKRALCATCKKSDPAETNLSRASRVRQDSQFHTVNKGGILLEWKILYRARILRAGGRSWPRRTGKLLAQIIKSKCVIIQSPAVKLWEVGDQLPIQVDKFSQIHWRLCK